ncbi:MAG: DMT family transporter [Bacteroidales bacterium]
MLQSHIGEFAALLTAICWTATALAFESASHKVGSIPVNIIRLVLAMLFLSLSTYIMRGMWLPTDATPKAWLWLSMSGLIGFVIGDLFLFKSYTVVGARISMLMMTLVPPMTALIGWLMLGETLSLFSIIGMTLTVGGIALVILNRGEGERRFTVSHSIRGLFYAFMGAVGQAFGLIFSKIGMGSYNAFAATQIRILTGIVGFVVLVTILRKWSGVMTGLRNLPAMKRITLGSVFGPFLGVSFSLYAIQHTSAGIASTIMSITPILIIPPSLLLMKQRITTKEIVGAIISVAGVALFFV